MPPPSMPQQGSKAALITTLVVFIILSLVFAVFYFQERGLRAKAESERDIAEKRPEGYLPPLSPEVPAKLKEAYDTARAQSGEAPADGATPSKPTLAPNATNAFDLVRGELDQLIAVVTGSTAATAREAKDFYQVGMKEAENLLRAEEQKVAQAGIKADGVSFSQPAPVVARQLVDAWAKLATDRIAVSADVEAEKAKLAAAQQNHTQLMAAEAKKLSDLQAQLAATTTNLTNLQQAHSVALEQVKNSNVGNIDALNQQISDLNSQLTALRPTIPPLQAEINRLKNSLRQFRMDPTDNIVRRTDGFITRISEDRKTCFINLGEGDQIATGMTFEVYDRQRGIPGLKEDIAGMDDETAKRTKEASARLAAAAERGTGGIAGVQAAARTGERYDSQLPQGGLGSIEVINIGPGKSAQCRIIKNDGFKEGDVVANLVYDPNVKFKFVVYGQFDLDYNGIPTISDTATIRRLIEQWGGRVVQANTVDDLTPDIDFIVMGIAPTIPTNLDPNNAVDQDLMAQAKKRLDAYKLFEERARGYSIPILNQTRFLYYTGFFDQRLR